MTGVSRRARGPIASGWAVMLVATGLLGIVGCGDTAPAGPSTGKNTNAAPAIEVKSKAGGVAKSNKGDLSDMIPKKER